MTQEKNPLTPRSAKMAPQTREEWRKGVNQAKRRATPLAWIITAAVLAIILVYLAFFFLLAGAPRQAWIKIPANATGKNVVDSLRKHLGEDFAGKVTVLLSVDEKASVPSGAYLVEKGQTVFSVAKRMRNHRQTPMRFTINHARTLSSLCELIGGKMGIPADSLQKVFTSADMLKKTGLTPEQAIALCFEDTYEEYWNGTARQIVDKLRSHYEKVWTPERRKKAQAMGLTPAEMMTVCSIVDEETNDAGEKGRIGRLYINRLKKNMRLQADPTVKYALGDFSIRRVGGDMLRIESPYNTYRVNGLPPGPIRTTSVATLDAVLGSAESNDLYMCAKEDFSGSHNFAPDFETHRVNAEKYQKALNERNIH